MPTSRPPAPAAAASQALAALERYRGDVARLATDWLNPELYHATSQELAAVRHACTGVPPLSATWVALLVAHAELVHGLWQTTRTAGSLAPADRQLLLQRVLHSVRELQQACMDLQAASKGS